MLSLSPLPPSLPLSPQTQTNTNTPQPRSPTLSSLPGETAATRGTSPSATRWPNDPPPAGDFSLKSPASRPPFISAQLAPGGSTHGAAATTIRDWRQVLEFGAWNLKSESTASLPSARLSSAGSPPLTTAALEESWRQLVLWLKCSTMAVSARPPVEAQ